MTPDDTKRCSKCWRHLPLAAFVLDKRTRDGLSYRCRDCKGLSPHQEDGQ